MSAGVDAGAHTDVDGGVDPLLASAWSRADLRSSLQVVVDAVVSAVGFDVACVVAGFGADQMRVIASSGRPDALAAIRGIAISMDRAEEVLAAAEDWGALRFAPDGSQDTPPSAWIAPEAELSDRKGEWQPGDELYLPFRDLAGQLVGFVSVDLPTDGRRPGADTRRQLESLGQIAGQAMLDALAAEQSRGLSRISTAARTVVRRASAQLDVAGVLSEALDAVRGEFGANGAWARLLERDSRLYSSSGWEFPRPIPDWIIDDLMASATRCWERQRVLEISHRLPSTELIGMAPYDYLVTRFDGAGLDSLVQVPLGAGDEFLGYLVMARPAGAPDWSPDEHEEAQSLGHDLGRAVLNARTFERERRLITELKHLDDYKRQLVSSFSHELRTPLTSLGTHLELLEHDVEEWPAADAPLSAMRRAVGRLGRLIDDLLLLSRLADTDRQLASTSIDLCAVVTTTLHALDAEAEGRRVGLQLGVPSAAVIVSGDQAELARAVSNVVANALSYTPVGGEVVVTVHADDDEGRVVVRDTGFGIHADDHSRLFDDFFRGTDATVRSRPGVGLGLGITERILLRHGGRVEFTSQLGEGSTFVLILPRARA